MFYTLLMNYNNYRNRIYKKEETLEAYVSASSGYIYGTDKSYNFSLNDDTMMEHVFNVEPFEGEPDYMLLLEETTGTPIHSRWFVINWIKIRGNQYKGLLRRDLLADNYEVITTSPSFIEKGFVPSSDSAIFNKEDMTFNQIKSGETLLKDDSNTAWIVGYVAQDHSALSNKTFTLNPAVDVTISGDFSDWAYHSWCDGNAHTSINVQNSYFRFYLRGRQYNNLINQISYTICDDYHNSETASSVNSSNWWIIPNGAIQEFENSNWWGNYLMSSIETALQSDNPSNVPKTDLSYLNSLAGKKLQFDDGIYQLTITSSSSIDADYINVSNTSNLYNYMYSATSTGLSSVISGGAIDYPNNNPVKYRLYKTTFRIVATKLTNIQGTYTYSIPQTVRKLGDAPYKMFAIPYYTGEKRYVFSLDGNTYVYIDKDIQLAWAMSIAKEFGANLYDLQILPYCPLSNWRGLISNVRDGIWSMDKTENVDYTTLIGASDVKYGYCSWCDVSSKEDYLVYPINVIDHKIDNECDMYRLCSPNYASAFEYSPAKNNGVEGYNVRFTYKPYQPFICVAPKFNRLYGNDYKDNRGLILSGDFSLPIITDAWVNYQLQNKNYQLAFDRQIENLEVNYGWQRGMGIANAITGTLQGGTTGAMAGGMMGGPYGAIAGAVVGTAASAVGGALDLRMQQALHDEAIDFSKDNFGFQLGNIQALPNTLNKVSSIIAISKLFPFVEYYTCTDEEKEALRNKIKYNGMTIGRIGTISDYLNPSDTTYVQGQLIRLEGKFDTHVANEIANEFKKGWYI